MKSITIVFLALLSLVVKAEKIEYEIYEKSSGELIGAGIKIYTKSDVILKPYISNGRQLAEKHIELEQGFKVGARIFPAHRLTGFGLVAEKTNKDFSWEWYNQTEGRTFEKLQGPKSLVSIRVSGLPAIEYLEEVKFLDDATLSFRLGGAGKPESHKIVVKKGSVLRFD